MSFARQDSDKEKLNALLDVSAPGDQELVELGALSMRYQYPHPLAVLAQDVAEGWGLSGFQLNKRCREIWSSGFRPASTDYGVGSANDTQEDS